jgi:hypothetical protein
LDFKGASKKKKGVRSEGWEERVESDTFVLVCRAKVGKTAKIDSVWDTECF